MSGNADGTFGTNKPLQREQFAQILYSMAGKPAVADDAENPFSDLKNKVKYPGPAVIWAYQNGIASGNGNGTFGVGSSIQRQAVAGMLYKYAEKNNYDLSVDENVLSAFSDADQVQTWAQTSMKWAVSQGIVSGTGSGKLNPTGNATRAECATMIYKLLTSNTGESDAKVGDIIVFGKYEQDGNLENGKEDIEWKVLSREEDKILVISKKVLDCIKFHNEYPNKGILWENCTLRSWLNNDFYNSAFTAEEQKSIPSVTLSNKGNSELGVPDGNDTTDKVFCLSREEVNTYFDGLTSSPVDTYNQNLICAPTMYSLMKAAKCGAGNMDFSCISEYEYFRNPYSYDYSRDVIDKEGVDWQLRSLVNADYNEDIGGIGRTGGNTQGWYTGLRPAMYIDISNVSIEIKEEKKEEREFYVDNSPYKYESLVRLGKYEQDGNLENGKEDIEWEVISVEKDRILLISRYVLDAKPYNDTDEEVTWETCSLRKWLNEDFYNEAFDEADKEKILLVNLENKGNSYYGNNGGNNTDDRIFCLSYDEVEKVCGHKYSSDYYNNIFRCVYNSDLLRSSLTKFAINNGGYYEGYQNSGRWWLRTPGRSQEEVLYSGGTTLFPNNSWSNVSSYCGTVRPAMYISY